MNEFGGLVLFAVVVALVITVVFALLYCCYFAICIRLHNPNPEPLANRENAEESIQHYPPGTRENYSNFP